jgi:hypothetical protein
MRLQSITLAMFMVLAGSFPASANKKPARPFYMPTAVTLDGAEVPQGMYQLILEPDRSGVRVELWRDGRFVATARGAWVKSGLKYKENTILLRVNPDGSRSLIELRLAGASKTIVLNSNADAAVQYTAK